jgi:hypothetical protein
MDYAMNRIVHRTLNLLVLAGAGLLGQAQPAPAYQTGFSDVEVGQLPGDFLVLSGQFAVRDLEGNRVLELPGTPLETHGLLFGPSARENQSVTARIQSTSRGRRSPAFALSLGGVSGFRLEVAAAKRTLEIMQGDQTLKAIPWAWQSGSWTHLRLQIRKVGEGSWVIEGKVWLHGQNEPAEPSITLERSQQPIAGRPGLWGKPFADTAILFDDVKVENL